MKFVILMIFLISGAVQANNKCMQKQVPLFWKSISKETALQVNVIRERILTIDQKKKVDTFAQSLLTAKQMDQVIELAATTPSKAKRVQGMLKIWTKEQFDKLAAYAQSLLTRGQLMEMGRLMLGALNPTERKRFIRIIQECQGRK